MLVIGGNGSDIGLPAQLLQRIEGLVVGGSGGRRGVLRIEREKYDALTSLFLHLLDGFNRRRISVPHTVVDFDLIAVKRMEFFAQLRNLILGNR